MPIATVGEIDLHYRLDGPETGAPLVFIHALGTRLDLWDDVVDRLPDGLRILRFDLRGHGQSSAPEAPYGMGALVKDVEGLLDYLNIRDAVCVGLSIGGMVAQGLAVKRLDQLRGLVLSNTAAKIATPAIWQDRIALIEDKGLSAIADPTLDRWLSRSNRQGPLSDRLRAMITSTSQPGYVGCCAAISGTDFYTPTSGLRLPTLGICGTEDGSTPADLVRETVGLIPGSQFHLIRKSGHMPCVEQPEEFTARLVEFLQQIGHIED